MYGYEILCGIIEAPFEIPRKKTYLYIERCDDLSTPWFTISYFWNTTLHFNIDNNEQHCKWLIK